MFKIRAYERAAETLRGLAEEASALAARGELINVPGIGKAINEKIQELLRTGKLKFLEGLEAEVPPSLLELLRVPGLGPKKVALFWKELGILTLADLEKAAAEGKLRSLPGMGEKSETSIIAGLASLSQRTHRMSCAPPKRANAGWTGCANNPAWNAPSPPAACAAGGKPSATWTWLSLSASPPR